MSSPPMTHIYPFLGVGAKHLFLNVNKRCLLVHSVLKLMPALSHLLLITGFSFLFKIFELFSEVSMKC